MKYIELIGIVAGILTTGAFLPQIIKILSSKKTEGLSLLTYSIFSTGSFLWLIYGIFRHSISIILANSVTFILNLIILIFIIIKNSAKNHHK